MHLHVLSNDFRVEVFSTHVNVHILSWLFLYVSSIFNLMVLADTDIADQQRADFYFPLLAWFNNNSLTKYIIYHTIKGRLCRLAAGF